MTTPNVDEQISFVEGSDDGQNDPNSIQPVNNAEYVWGAVLDRPTENIRQRTEVLRANGQDLNYYADYDRSLLLRSDGLFTLVQVTAGNYQLSLSGADLWIYSCLTPGRNSGGRYLGGRMWISGLPYAGTLGVNDLTLTASSQYTGQRGYADGTSFEGGGGNPAFSLGANGIIVSLVANPAIAGGTGTMTVVYSGSPKRIITLTYGTSSPTTLNDIITFINTDYTSSDDGGYGLANFFYATTTVASPALASPPTVTNAIFQGAYDAEAFQITVAQFAGFNGISANYMLEGESLAISFGPGLVQEGVGALGGRRQSLWDLPTNRLGGKAQNTTPSVGWNIFNTGRQPELIPNSIPIGKVINGSFVFTDGTRIPDTTGSPMGYALGESPAVYSRLASITPPTGASLIGWTSTTFWNDDDNTQPTSHTVQAALDEIVSDLASEITSHSGGRRVGSDAVIGSSSTLNPAFSLNPGSIHEQLTGLLTALASPGVAGGVNARVSEYGHQMHGPYPIQKNFGEIPTYQGQEFIRSFLQPLASPGTPFGNYSENAISILQPIVLTPIGITGANPVDNGGGAAAPQLRLIGLSDLDALILSGYLSPATLITGASGYTQGPLYHCVVQVQGVGGTGGALNAYYYLGSIQELSPGNHAVGLVNINTTLPNFALAGVDYTSATITFYFSVLIGGDNGGRRIRAFLPSICPPYNTFTQYEAGNATAPIAITVPSSPLSGQVGDQSIIDLFSSSGAEGHGAIWHASISPRRAIWSGNDTGIPAVTDLLAPTTIIRNTDNILIGGDKVLLSGVETGSPVDATLNHNHNIYYTKYRSLNDGDAYNVIWATFGSASLPLTNFPDNTPTGYLSAFIPPGMFVQAVVVEFRLVIDYHAASAGDIQNIVIYASAGQTHVIANPVTAISFADVAPDTADHTGIIVIAQATIPCDATGQFTVSLHLHQLDIVDASTFLDATVVGFHAFM